MRRNKIWASLLKIWINWTSKKTKNKRFWMNWKSKWIRWTRNWRRPKIWSEIWKMRKSVGPKKKKSWPKNKNSNTERPYYVLHFWVISGLSTKNLETKWISNLKTILSNEKSCFKKNLEWKIFWLPKWKSRFGILKVYRWMSYRFKTVFWLIELQDILFVLILNYRR